MHMLLANTLVEIRLIVMFSALHLGQLWLDSDIN